MLVAVAVIVMVVVMVMPVTVIMTVAVQKFGLEIKNAIKVESVAT